MLLTALVHDPRDRDRRNHLHQVRCKAFEQTPSSLILDRLVEDVHNASVALRVKYGALALETSAEDVERIDDACTEGSGEATNDCGGEASRFSVIFVTATCFGVAYRDGTLQVLKCTHVDGCVGKDSKDAHWKTTVEGNNSVGSPHLASSFPNQSITAQTSGDGLALHTAKSCEWESRG
jgi:hypothetical protein